MYLTHTVTLRDRDIQVLRNRVSQIVDTFLVWTMLRTKKIELKKIKTQLQGISIYNQNINLLDCFKVKEKSHIFFIIVIKHIGVQYFVACL